MSLYIKYKKERTGRCNICKKDSTLTWDHVPPQGSIDVTSVEMESLLGRLAPGISRPEISQNGVKYRTVCATCNNLMGRRYDPVLKQFSQDVGQFLKSQLHFPEIIHIQSHPTAIIRAIVGHLLAASMYPDGGLGSQDLGDFVLNESEPVPNNISVLYWLFPYPIISVVRDIAMPAVRGSFDKVGGFNMIKFFPIAYLVTDLNEYENLHDLTMFRGLDARERAEVPVDLRSVRGVQWPDRVDDGNVILGGAPMESSIYARPRASQ